MASDEAVKILLDAHNDLIVVMQAAFIEWEHGGGAEAAMIYSSSGNTAAEPRQQ